MHKNVVPMFHVPDVRRTVDWYRDLGFEVVETYSYDGEGLSFAIVSFGAGQVMFSPGGQLGRRFCGPTRAGIKATAAWQC